MRNIGDEKCLLLLGFTGSDALVKMARKAALDITGDQGGVHVGRTFGSQWHKGRFHTPYLRNSLWEVGYAVDTLETAVPWQTVPALLNAIETALRPGLADIGEKVHVFTHLSHVYPTGASIYATYLFRLADDPDETLHRWQTLKAAASEAIVQHQGTISHQHGVGADHAPYLVAEKGELGMAALADLSRRFDPVGMMNPGKLLTHDV
jgi:alkyldihydroxyacetonephosphate synthase